MEGQAFAEREVIGLLVRADGVGVDHLGLRLEIVIHGKQRVPDQIGHVAHRVIRAEQRIHLLNVADVANSQYALRVCGKCHRCRQRCGRRERLKGFRKHPVPPMNQSQDGFSAIAYSI